MDEKTFEFLEKILTEVQGVKQELQEVKNEVKEVKTDLKEVKNEVKQNSNHILRLEDKMENKFGALFDNREVTNEKLDSIETKVDDVARSVINIELITSKNWNDIAILKKAK